MDIKGMNFYVQRVVTGEQNIQTELYLIFLLEGELTIRYQDEKYRMKQEDIILINP